MSPFFCCHESFTYDINKVLTAATPINVLVSCGEFKPILDLLINSHFNKSINQNLLKYCSLICCADILIIQCLGVPLFLCLLSSFFVCVEGRLKASANRNSRSIWDHLLAFRSIGQDLATWSTWQHLSASGLATFTC